MVRIVESQNKFGTMNSSTLRYSNLTEEDKELISYMRGIDLDQLSKYDLSKDKELLLRIHRKNFGDAIGVNGDRIFKADQSDQTGSFFEIKEKYVGNHPKGWSEIPHDILVVTHKTPNVVIGHAVSDFPVVMMIDKRQGVSAIGHCNGHFINSYLPIKITEVLRNHYKSNLWDIFAYVSACAGDEWVCEELPKWAQNPAIWEKSILYDEKGQLHMNLKPAILMQIIHSGILPQNILFNLDNTITNPHYYSSYASGRKRYHQDKKFGRHFAGLYYDEEDSNQIEIFKGKSLVYKK